VGQQPAQVSCDAPTVIVRSGAGIPPDVGGDATPSLATHGGLAAGLRLGGRPLVLDGARLSEVDAGTLGDLVEAARAEPDPERTWSAPDAMSYTVTVEDDSGTGVLRRSDDAMTPAFAALLDWLNGHGSGGRPRAGA
jgi:hypothetical protein